MQKYSYLFLCLFLTTILAAQNNQVRFGKNRVQYHDDFDEWLQYESENFVTYWYGQSRNIGQSAVQFAEYDFEEIQSILEHRMNEKIEIIVYTDITDLKQSNIGTEEAFINTGGQTKIVGNKIFIYFNGNHDHLRSQIRQGIASVYLDAMLFGSNLQEIVQNALMMNLPDWFKIGFVAYVGQDWDSDLDNELRDIILSQKYENFEKFAEESPELAGHSLWHFLGSSYGNTTISNLLYLTRINRSIESSFLYVLGNSFDYVLENWKAYYENRYKIDLEGTAAAPSNYLKLNNKRDLPITQVKLSPDGYRVAYILNEIGKAKIFIHDSRSNKTSKVFKDGFKNPFQATDYNYPLIAWSPDNVTLNIVYEERDVIKMMQYNTSTGKSEEEQFGPQFQRIYSMDYIDPNTMIVSGAQNGYSDLFLYFVRTRSFQRITNDFYDDLDVAYVEVEGRKGILFSSNRTDSLLMPMKMDTILPIRNFDLFYYDLDAKTNEFVQVTHTPFANESQPVAIDGKYFSFLSDENGINNRFMGELEEYIAFYNQRIFLTDGDEIVLHADSTLESLDSSLIDTVILEPVIKERGVVRAISNYNSNVIKYHTAPKTDQQVQMFLVNGVHQITRNPLDTAQTYQLKSTVFRRSRNSYFPFTSDYDRSPTTMDNGYIPPAPQIQTQPVEVPIDNQVVGAVPVPNDTIVPTEKIQPNDTLEYYFQVPFLVDDDPVSETPEQQQQTAPTITQNNVQQGIRTTPLKRDFGYFVERNDEIIQRYEEQPVHKFRPSQIIPYRLKFRTDYVVTQMDNSLLFDGLETFAANEDDIFQYPPPGILLKANFKDLFEDYEIEGGVRVPTTFNGTEYFLTFNNKKKRLDKIFNFYRKNTRLSEPSNSILPNVPNRRDVNILLGQFGVRYPLDIFRSVRAIATLRRDQTTQLAADLPTFNTPTVTQQRAGLKVEYVFDNTLDVALNIKNGTRYKVFAEVYKRFDLQLANGISLDFNEGAMGIVGFDFRHYQRILKHSVFANRAAFATSFGSERMLYFMGGVENWLFPSENNDIPRPGAGENFAFRTIAANLRGFDLNIRNGNSFALINSELRVPMFKYIFKRLRSSLLENFQLVGFFDIGSAWQGDSPFNEDNPLNTDIIENSENPLVRVKVNLFRDPIVMGYGAGIRTMLFGYFIRVDYGWGIETRVVQDPKLYISIGTDF